MVIAEQHGIREAYSNDSVAEQYVNVRFSNELNRILHEKQVASVQRAIDETKPARVLEIAPGPGRLTRDVRAPSLHFCLEYNPPMIERGREACDAALHWIRGDGFKIPFSQSFDLVYSFRFVRHFLGEDRTRLYSEIRRVLAPAGLFVMDAVNERVSAPLRAAHAEEYPIYDELYRPETLRTELESAGFEIISLQPVQRWFRWQYRSQVLLGPRIQWLNRMVIRGLERLPFGDSLEWVVTCRRA